jgi:hypothetical protein
MKTGGEMKCNKKETSIFKVKIAGRIATSKTTE